MNIVKYPTDLAADAAVKAQEPMLALISFDGENAILSPIDDAMEHHILLAKTGHSSLDIDKYFRIVLDGDGADWTFICPPDYKGIPDRTRRIASFYRDGFAAISSFLQEIGYLVGIDIPRRYRRHLEALGE